MKNLLTLVLLFLCVTIFSQDIAENDFSSEIDVVDEKTKANKEVITFDRKNFKVEVNNFDNEIVKGVYFFDSKKKLISKTKNFATNSSIKFNVKGISLVNVVTDKGYYFTLIRK